MNIVMIGWYKPQVGGGSHVVQNLVKQLKVKGHNIFIINMEERSLPYFGQWEDNGIRVFQEKLYFNQYTLIQELIQTTKRALLLKKQVSVDLYHVHSPSFAGIGFIDKKTPMIMTMHGYPSLEAVAIGRIRENSPQFKAIRFLEIATVARADAVIAVDKRIYKWVISDLDASSEKVFYIPNAVDVHKFNPKTRGDKIREEYNIGDRPLILYVKALSPKNGPEIAIRAMRYIREEYPDAILLMVGDGPLRQKLTKLTSELKLENNIIFAGRKPPEETPLYFAASDVVVVPSVHISGVEEATSLTMLEGMASRKPVVVSNIGGLKETIEDSGGNWEAGVMFKERDPKDLASKIVYLLDSPSLRKKLGHNARKYVVKKRSWEVYVQKVLEVYEYVLQKQTK
ncbi:glycosyltransferase family 4 protein [Thermococcus sp. 2319x1]|uniref:glycosyltransferase family 4 protein n=1 Tax=Thermococcus sp. 2319x1 TaxID=1674923 RepID=UPI00158303C3|nr:glycosyltransferase family 4 protein [Thermococcus sp. 2319x1]